MAKYINPYTDFGFKKRFDTAELASLTAQQRDSYEQNLIQYSDLKSVLETAVEEKQMEIAKSLLETSFSNEEIAKHTGLKVEEIKQLRDETKKNG